MIRALPLYRRAEMKRFLLIASVLMATWIIQSVQADGQMYSITELNQMGQPEWKETYQTNGRTVEVDCVVYIPDVSQFPVLTVQTMPPVEEPLYSTLYQRYAAPKGTKRHYEFRSNDYQTVLTFADPGGWDEKAGEIPGKVTERWHSLLKYDLNSAYADNNDLPLWDAFFIAQSRLGEAFPGLELKLMDVALHDRLQNKNSGQYLREKGCYYLYCTQKLHGIPFLAPIAAAFVNYGSMPYNLYALRQRGIVYAAIYDQDSFSINSYSWKESAVLYDDVPLLSFEQVKSKLEALIMSGNIRYVYHVGLGYVQYCANENGDAPYTLVPAYVAWCEYCNDEKAEPLASKDEGADIFLGNPQNFQPIIINAQTGEVHDNQSEDYSLAIAPEIIK